jgi:hypothetical protein
MNPGRHGTIRPVEAADEDPRGDKVKKVKFKYDWLHWLGRNPICSCTDRTMEDAFEKSGNGHRI